MFKFLLGLVFGSGLAAVVAAFIVVPELRANSKAVGFNDGLISARTDIAEAIAATLGADVISSEKQRLLFSVKARDVVIVERNGVQTVRASQ